VFGAVGLAVCVAGGCKKGVAGTSDIDRLHAYERQLEQHALALRTRGVDPGDSPPGTPIARADGRRSRGADGTDDRDKDQDKHQDYGPAADEAADAGAAAPNEAEFSEAAAASEPAAAEELAPQTPVFTPNSARDPRKCRQICDLAAAACELEEQACRLAQRHRAEPRYDSVCKRAERQCARAEAACRACAH
jgi:hypothetical protein